MPDTNTTLVPATQSPLSRDIIKEIAMDIGKAAAVHIEVMYPGAVEATSKNMLRSLQGAVYNEIMAALELVDETAIHQRLAERDARRRKLRAAYRRMRDKPAKGAVVIDA